MSRMTFDLGVGGGLGLGLGFGFGFGLGLTCIDELGPSAPTLVSYHPSGPARPKQAGRRAHQRGDICPTHRLTDAL